MTVQWPWQRASSDAHPSREVWGASSEQPMGWAFAPAFPRMLATETPSMLSDSFLATLPTRLDPRSMGRLDHLVSVDAPSALLGVAPTTATSASTDERATQATAATEDLLAVLVNRHGVGTGSHGTDTSTDASTHTSTHTSTNASDSALTVASVAPDETRAAILSDAEAVVREEPDRATAGPTPPAEPRDTGSRATPAAAATRPRLGIGAPLRSAAAVAASSSPTIQRAPADDAAVISRTAAPTDSAAGSLDTDTDHVSTPPVETSEATAPAAPGAAALPALSVAHTPSAGAVARLVVQRPVAPERRAPLSSSRALVSYVRGGGPTVGESRSGGTVVQRLADTAVPSPSGSNEPASPVLDRRRVGIDTAVTASAAPPAARPNGDSPRTGGTRNSSAPSSRATAAQAQRAPVIQRAVSGTTSAPTRAVAHHEAPRSSAGVPASPAVAATPVSTPVLPDPEPSIQRAASPASELIGAGRSLAAAPAAPTQVISGPAPLDPVHMPPEVIEHLANRLMGPILRRLKSEMLVDRERRGLRTDLRRGAVL